MSPDYALVGRLTLGLVAVLCALVAVGIHALSLTTYQDSTTGSGLATWRQRLAAQLLAALMYSGAAFLGWQAIR